LGEFRVLFMPMWRKGQMELERGIGRPSFEEVVVVRRERS